MLQISTVWLAAADVLPTADSQASWVTLVLRELGRSQAAGFLFSVALWTLLGAALGVITAVVACVIFSRLGWYELRWRYARGFRWTTYALTVTLAVVLFGLAGFWNGAIHGSERVLAKSQLATDVFPEIGDVIADGMAWVQIRAASSGGTNSAEVSLKRAEFQAGKWELHAAQFLKQLDGFQGEALTDFIARLESSALEQAPQLKGGIGEKLLHELLNGLGRLMVEKKVSSELKKHGADRIYFAIREQLTAEAVKAGNPDTITRQEISKFIVREGIIPGIMKPIRSTARTQQLFLLGIAVLVMVLPPLGFRFGNRRLGGSAMPDAPPPPAQPPVP